jgi:hypothetical protein
MKFHSLEQLSKRNDAPISARLLRLVVSAVAGAVILGGLVLAIPLGT